MMQGKVYYGMCLQECKEVAPKALVFEEHFSAFMGSQYDIAWTQLRNSGYTGDVICKTSDAIMSSPDGMTILRVGKSIRDSNKGQVILTEISKEIYSMISPH
jgi:hypothetical protein